MPCPLAARISPEDGVSFVLFSRHATRVHLELYQNANDSYAARSIGGDPVRHRTGDIWHVWVRGMRRLTILQTMVDLNTIHHKEGRPSRT